MTYERIDYLYDLQDQGAFYGLSSLNYEQIYFEALERYMNY